VRPVGFVVSGEGLESGVSGRLDPHRLCRLLEKAGRSLVYIIRGLAQLGLAGLAFAEKEEIVFTLPLHPLTRQQCPTVFRFQWLTQKD